MKYFSKIGLLILPLLLLATGAAHCADLVATTSEEQQNDEYAAVVASDSELSDEKSEERAVVEERRLEFHGRITTEGYHYSDNNSPEDRQSLTVRVRLDVTGLSKSADIGIHFDGRGRRRFVDGKTDDSERLARFNTLYLDFKGWDKKVYMAMGRLYPKDVSLERIDGANLSVRGKRLGIGLFGGLRPDPYTYGINADFIIAGANVFYHGKGVTANVAMINDWYKGETDRQYVYGQFSYYPVRQVRLYSSATLDINQITDRVVVTNAFVEGSYRPDSKKSVSVGYNQFRSYQLFESMTYTVDTSRQESYYVRGSVRPIDALTVFAKAQRNVTVYEDTDEERRKRDSYTLGFRYSDLLGTGTGVTVTANVVPSHNSKHNTYSARVNRAFGDIFEIELNGAYNHTEYTVTDEVDKVVTYGAKGNLRLGKNWRGTLTYEGTKAKDNTTNSLFTGLVYRF